MCTNILSIRNSKVKNDINVLAIQWHIQEIIIVLVNIIIGVCVRVCVVGLVDVFLFVLLLHNPYSVFIAIRNYLLSLHSVMLDNVFLSFLIWKLLFISYYFMLDCVDRIRKRAQSVAVLCALNVTIKLQYNHNKCEVELSKQVNTVKASEF